MSQIQEVPIEAVTAVTQRAVTLADEARACIVRDDEANVAAAEFLRHTIKAALKQADEAFDPIIRANHAAHKLAVAQKAGAVAPLLEAERIVKAAMGAYAQRLLEEQRAELRRAEEAQRAAAAEQRRLQAEQQQRAEEARLAEAVRLADAGKPAAADALLAAPVVVEPVVAAPVYAKYIPPPKAAGISTKMVWKFSIADPKAVAREYCVPNEVAIRALVAAHGAAAAALVGGIEVWEEPVVSARAP